MFVELRELLCSGAIRRHHRIAIKRLFIQKVICIKDREEADMLRSEEVRKLAPEMDPLRMGMGWKVSDLSKPQVMVESSYGDSHPGSAHLNIFVEEPLSLSDSSSSCSKPLESCTLAGVVAYERITLLPLSTLTCCL